MFKKTTLTITPLCLCIALMIYILPKSLEKFTLPITPYKPIHLIIAIDQNPAMGGYSKKETPFIQAKALAKELILLFKRSHLSLLEFQHAVNPLSILTTDTHYLLNKLNELPHKFSQSQARESNLTHVYDYANMTFNYPLKSDRWLIILSNGHISSSPLLKQKKNLYRLKPIFVELGPFKSNLKTLGDTKMTALHKPYSSSQKTNRFKELSYSNQALFVQHKSIEKSAQTIYKHIIRQQKSISIKNTKHMLLPILCVLLCYSFWLIFCRIPKNKLFTFGLFMSLCFLFYPSSLHAFSRQLHKGVSDSELQLIFSQELKKDSPLFTFKNSFIPNHLQVKSVEHFIKVTQKNNTLKAKQFTIATLNKPQNTTLYLPELSIDLSPGLALSPAETILLSKLPGSISSPNMILNDSIENPESFIFKSEPTQDALFPLQEYLNRYYILTRNFYFKEILIQLHDFSLSKPKTMWFCPEKKVFERFGLRYYKTRVLCEKTFPQSHSLEKTAFLVSLNKTAFISKAFEKTLLKKQLPKPLPDLFKNAYNIQEITLLNRPKKIAQQNNFLIHINVKGESLSNLNALEISNSKAFQISLIDRFENLFSKQFTYMISPLEEGTYPFPSFSATYFDTQQNLFVQKSSSSFDISIELSNKNQSLSETSTELFVYKPKSWFYRYALIIGILVSLIVFLLPKKYFKNIKLNFCYFITFSFIIVCLESKTFASTCPKHIPNTLLMSTQKVFSMAKACYESQDLVKAKGLLFKAYQKRPFDSEIKQTYKKLSSQQIDPSIDIFSSKFSNIIALNYLSLTDMLCINLALILIGLILLRKKTIPLYVTLSLIMISNLNFGYKFIKVIGDHYAIVKSGRAQIFLENKKTLSPIGWAHQGLLLEIGTTKTDYMKIKHQGLNLWIKKTDIWIIP